MTIKRIAILLSVPACLVAGSLFAAKPGDETVPDEPKVEQREPARDDEFDSKVAKFMRQKLDASGAVLEGLVTEDFEMIAKGAKSMEAMSRAADWQMLKSAEYIQFSNGFRKACEDLAAAAKEKNVDAAGLDYMRLTMGCIACHNYVRKTMMAEGLNRPSFDIAGRP